MLAGGDSLPELFATETVAELSARQGRVGEAIAIYRKLLSNGRPDDERRARWGARLAALEEENRRARPVADVRPAPPPRQPSRHRLPLVIREPVRSGQLVYAEENDLIVLAPVNPGAQLLADGNIHVYGRLRGRAVAGARGATDAQLFCQRLEAELVGVDAAYLTSEAIPFDRWGQGARIFWQAGRCQLAPLT